MKRGVTRKGEQMRTDGDREQNKRECWLMEISYAARPVEKGTHCGAPAQMCVYTVDIDGALYKLKGTILAN